ncbi:hypothetical protein MKX03_012695 [Papaver bracteatum]|nr:hypothetical protein MKX03_012695 [Papaver bracteatum]
MECLPPDVVLDILSRLPAESVLDCKRLLNILSHRWDHTGDASSSSAGLLFAFNKDEEDQTIGSRLYYGDKYNDEVNIHENFSYKTLHKTSVSFSHMLGSDVIVGSYNGLICLLRYHHGIPDPIHICNPNTGEYVNLPEYAIREEEEYAAAYGFGCIQSMTNNQYKIVRIYYPASEKYKNGRVQVYTLSSGGWRTIGRTSYQLFTQQPLGTYVNGSLYWIDKKKIMAFNLVDEEFRLIQPPPCYDDPSHNCNYCFDMVLALKGNLYFCHQNNKEHLLYIWSLKKNTTEVSWSRDFSIAYNSACETDDEYPVQPLLITKKNEVLFVHQGSTLYCYDPKTAVVIKLWDDDSKSELIWLTAFPHMNSFVSLRALGERCESKKKLRERSLQDTEY